MPQNQKSISQNVEEIGIEEQMKAQNEEENNQENVKIDEIEKSNEPSMLE